MLESGAWLSASLLNGCVEKDSLAENFHVTRVSPCLGLGDKFLPFLQVERKLPGMKQF